MNGDWIMTSYMSPRDRADIVDRWREGWPLDQLAHRHEINVRTVRRVIEQHGERAA